MSGGSGARAGWIVWILLVLVVSGPARGATVMHRVAERGPSTPVVGVAFALMGPPLLVVATARGQPVRLHACRFAHGVKMIAAGAILLPAGLLATPFAVGRVPDGWMDGIIDAFQEDSCTRPPASVLP